MKKLFGGLLILICLGLTACGGGGSDSGSGGNGGGGLPNNTVPFTTQMLDASPTYYISYAGDPNGTTSVGTTQETIVFSGSNGNYQASITSIYYDASQNQVSTDTFTAAVTLNANGTLTAVVTGQPNNSFGLTEITATYLTVAGADGTDTWTDAWYLAQPVGWIGGGNTEFTAAMLDVSPTYYISYAGDLNGTTSIGTTQETYAFSGSGGTYVMTISQEYFDGSNVSQGVTTLTANVTLNADGTLTAVITGSPDTTLTLNGISPSYLAITGNDGVDPAWTETWYLSQPAGWLTGGGNSAYTIPSQMLRHQVSASFDLYRGIISISDAGSAITPQEFASVTVTNSSNATVQPTNVPFISTGSYVAGNCTGNPCTWSSVSDSSVIVSFSTLPVDTYTFNITMTDSSQLTAVLPFTQDITLPYVDSATMSASWSGSDLNLSWTNPTAATNWSSVNQVRIVLKDASNQDVAYVKVPLASSSVVLPAAMLDVMRTLGDGTLATWHVQTRTIGNADNNQIARGYSASVALP